MSRFTPPLISLFFFSAFVVAGIYAPDCSLTWVWSFNSLGQNACTVAAFMMSTCNEGSYTVDALPEGYHYSGPYASQGGDLCLCNPIGYSLFSACDGCQGSNWISYADFVYNCTTTLPASSFPNPIPAGTRLPQWALLDVTGYWDADNAMAVGDSPELLPGAILGPAGSTPVRPSTTHSPSYPSSSLASPAMTVPSTIITASLASSVGASSNTSTLGPAGYIGGHSSNAGAIAGGTVAGIAVISIIVVALFFYNRQRRRSLAQPAPSTGDGADGAYYPHAHVNEVPPRPLSVQETVISSLPETSASLLRPYNPDDPATYPTYQVTSPPPVYHPNLSPSSSSSRNLYTIATPPNSQGHGLGYNGLQPIEQQSQQFKEYN